MREIWLGKHLSIVHVLLLLVSVTQIGCEDVEVSLPFPKPPVIGEIRPGEQIEPTVNVCSSNVQFLGGSKLRDNQALASLYQRKACDLVVVQELIAPPNLTLLPASPHYQSKETPHFSDGEDFVANEKNTAFFLAMQAAGYDQFWLSEEDTGNSEKNQSNGTNTEWFLVFYKSQVVKPNLNLPNGFLAEDRTHNPNFDRVPYAFAFSTVDDSVDFVLINVHLHPGGGKVDRARRKVELTGIFDWITLQKTLSTEKDFVILGDMNLEDNAELIDITPPDYVSLNTAAAIMTNTNINGPKPYDHVMVSREHTPEIDSENNFEVINLIQELAGDWAEKHTEAIFPGDPYNHDLFRFYYTDHHPVAFKLKSLGKDDD